MKSDCVMKEPKLKTITIDYRVELEFDVRHIPSDVLDAIEYVINNLI